LVGGRDPISQGARQEIVDFRNKQSSFDAGDGTGAWGIVGYRSSSKSPKASKVVR
jgi:hypothetical protein